MDRILVLDFGGQYDRLIARRVRAENVFAEIKRFGSLTCEAVRDGGYSGIIFTGGPNSVNDPSAPHFDLRILELGVPVLGICYGHQLMAQMAGGSVSPAESGSEYGKTPLYVSGSRLFEGVPEKSICWMSHTDRVDALPPGFEAVGRTDCCSVAAMCDEERRLYGVQFHPEVTHTEYGTRILRNFIFGICGCKGDWKMDDFIESSVERFRTELEGKKVLLALSGGVDSSVAAVLLNRAVGISLQCVFVDHGLLRKGEGDYVENVIGGKLGVNVIRVNAQDRFLEKLSGVTDPEKKRHIIGEEFVRVFEATARSLGKAEILAQGTIYPDVIESGSGDSAKIKSHHNVGGLPERMGFSGIAEPLRDLFKDEVREVGMKLGIPRELVYRQPFPGPGLAVRVTGEITKEKLDILREADAILREETDKARPDPMPDQYFAVLADTRSVGVMGDARTYGYTIALRAVCTDDFMTAQWSRLPYDLLERISTRITNEVRGVSRVVFDITSKPPATVEWE